MNFIPCTLNFLDFLKGQHNMSNVDGKTGPKALENLRNKPIAF